MSALYKERIKNSKNLTRNIKKVNSFLKKTAYRTELIV